jgi:hypothetical protein
MSGRFSRSTLALALTVGALVVAGCGGSSNSNSTSPSSSAPVTQTGPQLTPQSWGTRIQAIFNQLKAAAAPVSSNGRDPNTWYGLATKLDQMHSEVAALKPPSNLASLNSAIVAGLAPLGAQARTIGDDVKNGDQTSAKTDATKFVRGLLGLYTKMATALLRLKGAGTGT